MKQIFAFSLRFDFLERLLGREENFPSLVMPAMAKRNTREKKSPESSAGEI